MNKKILMIAYYYPPQGGGGVQRTVKFAKYLPKFGIEPIILTADVDDKKNPDQSFTSAFSHTIIRAKAPNFSPRISRLLEPFMVPDTQRIWINKAIKKGLVAAVRNRVRVIYSTSTPYSNHLVGYRIAKKLGLPWIADFRDLWTQNALYMPRAFYQRYFHERLEKLIYREAAHICCASPTQRKVVMSKFRVPSAKITTITNGFDPTDFTVSDNATLRKKALGRANDRSSDKKITISYFGSFYGAYRPDDFIEAIKIIKHNRPQSLREVSFLFVGDMDRQTRNLLSDSQLSGQIILKKYVPHAKLSALRQASDAFFLYLPKVLGPIGAMIPQKLYEYLATDKPIFAVVPDSDAGRIIKKLGAGEIVEPGDPRSIAQRLEKFLRDLPTRQEGKNQPKNRSYKDKLNRYSRPFLTKQLATIINKLDADS